MVLKTLGAGLLSAPLALNGPGGHQLLHEAGLRVAFMDAVTFAEELEGHRITFSAFKEFAPFYLVHYFGDDKDGFERSIKLLSLSLCIPNDNEGGSDIPQNYPLACHASLRHEENEKERGTTRPKLDSI